MRKNASYHLLKPAAGQRRQLLTRRPQWHDQDPDWARVIVTNHYSPFAQIPQIGSEIISAGAPRCTPENLNKMPLTHERSLTVPTGRLRVQTRLVGLTRFERAD